MLGDVDNGGDSDLIRSSNSSRDVAMLYLVGALCYMKASYNDMIQKSLVAKLAISLMGGSPYL